MSTWTADLTNDPSNDYDLYIELQEDGAFRGRIVRDGEARLQLVIYANENGVRIPAGWLVSVMRAAESDM